MYLQLQCQLGLQVYPYQATIIKQLAPCLDDHKRLVRKEAVDARSKWYVEHWKSTQCVCVCVCVRARAVKVNVSFELDDYFLPQGKHIVDFVI